MYALVLELCKFKPRQVLLCGSLMLGLSLFEGVSIAAILPILSLTKAVPTHYSSQLLGLINRLGIHQVAVALALGLFILLVSFTALLQRQQTVATQELQQTFNSHLSARLYQALALTHWEFWLTKTRADINHVISNEIGRVTLGCYFLFQLLTNCLLLIIYGLLSFMVSAKLTMLIVAAGSGVFWFFRFLVKKSRTIGLAISTFNQQLIFKLTEHLNGMKEVKCYGLEQQQLKQLITARSAVEHNYLNFTRSQSLLDLIYKVSAALFISLIFYLALGVFHLTSLDLILVVIIFIRTWPRIGSIQTSLQAVAMSLPAFEQINKLQQEAYFATQPKQSQTEQPKAESSIISILPALTFNELVVDKLSFCYSNTPKPTLNNISFKIQRGTFMACIGSSGSGKSTLADLLLGLLVPSAGQISINGQSLTSASQPSPELPDTPSYSFSLKHQWQNLISYVPQDIFLFNASIRENLCWSAVNISDTEIWEVLKLVQLYNLVYGLTNQLDSLVGDRGIQLSGGERQRLVLARALLRKPQFLILDEATSNLDQQNELLIQQTLEQLRGQLTIFVIAHRISTIKAADQILVLNQGELIATGTYSELITSHSSYFGPA